MTANVKKAIPLRSVDGARLSTDGTMTFMQVTTDKGGKYIWSLPSDQLEGMMLVVSAMADQAARLAAAIPRRARPCRCRNGPWPATKTTISS
jgi:hypothetical protein